MTRYQMQQWIDEAVWFANLSELAPNYDEIIDAVENGDVRPDDNDGLITDPTEQMLFGALVSGDARFWHEVAA